MGKIKELPSSSSHLLTCTQVITSINCVVKELVENAIDSCSKTVEVKLVDYGLDKIEVKDSGSGIHKDDVSKVAKPHCTSKITSHLDLKNVQTYGFRGEALSALCALSDLLIITKTAEEEFGFSYSFDHKGNITSSKPCPCTQGTTVSAVNLFKNVPVRKQYYRTDKAKKEELKKVEDTLIAFACIHPDLRLALFHNQSLIWQKPTVKTIREGLVSIFGNFIVDYMQNCEFTDEQSQVNIEVFLPKDDSPPLCSTTSTNRSIISINKRPVRMKAIDKVLKEYFNKSKNFSKNRYPICYIAINVPPSETDINVEPNKTTVMLNNLDAIISQLSAILKTFYDSNPAAEVAAKHDPTPINYECSKNYLNQNCSTKILSLDTNLNKSDINVIPSPLLTPEAPNSKNKCLSRKLSRQSGDKSTLPTKKIKTSNISCTKPNELYRHIQTLDSFLQSSETNDHVKLNQGTQCDEDICDFEILLGCMAPKEPELSSDLSLSIISPDKFQSAKIMDARANPLVDNFSNNKSHVSMTVERKNLMDSNSSDQLLSSIISETPLNSETNETSVEININYSKHFANKSELDADQCKTPNKEPSIGNGKSPSNCDASFKRANKEPSIGNRKNCDESFKTLNKEPSIGNEKSPSNCDESFKTAKSILESNEKNNNLQQYPIEDKVTTNVSFPKEISVNDNNTHPSGDLVENWSRGKHLIKDLEPTTVLKQQVVKNKESPILKENNDKGQMHDILINQRKMTAFDFFCRKYRLEIASLHPNMNNNQLAQILSERWNDLASDEKAIYKNMVDKDYPKNVKKKENLGKSISQNLNKKKEIANKPKKKIKRKYPEKTIPFEVEMSKNVSSINSCTVASEEFNIINCISPGIWLYSHQNKIILLNTFRLQEIIIYQRLLETFMFDPEPLEFPCIVSTNSLGEEAMEIIFRIYNDSNNTGKVLLDERIIANGFKINVIKNDEEKHIQVIGMTKKLAFYGVLDLKEILKVLKEKGTGTKLSECRPEKVKLYLQSEAVRMARQCPPCTKVDFVKDLLKKMKCLPPNCDKCIHSKPLIHEIHKIS